MNVGELKKALEDVSDDLPVELAVNYENCWHIQDLAEAQVACPFDKREWVVLKGEKEANGRW